MASSRGFALNPIVLDSEEWNGKRFRDKIRWTVDIIIGVVHWPSRGSLRNVPTIDTHHHCDVLLHEFHGEQRQSAGDNRTPRVYEALVDRLLASPQFGERWGRHWLDVVRYAESTGMTRNYPFPNAWRYRDYVIDSFNSDKPYDQFVMEQIAGDLLPEKKSMTAAEKDERLIATGFLALGPKDLNEKNALQFTMDNVDEQIDVISRSMLALTVSCARCHDHKFGPIPTSDYYAMAGIFRSTQLLSGYGARQGGGNKMETKNLIALGSAASLPGPAEPAVNRDAEDAQRVKLHKQLIELQSQIKKTEEAKEVAKEALKPRRANGKDQNNDGKADKLEKHEASLTKKLAERRTQAAVVEGQIKKLEKISGDKGDKGDKAATSGAQEKKLEGAAAGFAMGASDGRAMDSVIFLRGEVDKP